MTQRVQVILSDEEVALLKRQAAVEDLSLSAWLRKAATERLARVNEKKRIQSLNELREFFKGCDAREQGQEPDWEEHRRLISESIARGLSQT